MNRVVRTQHLRLALVADSGLQLGTVYPLSELRQTIGRDVAVSIPVDDTKVSREHAVVDYQNGYFYLIDLGSTNGTFLNGRKVAHANRLSLGDHIRVGTSVFRVELLKKAQEKAPKLWREPTRIIEIQKEEELPKKPHLPPTPSFEGDFSRPQAPAMSSKSRALLAKFLPVATLQVEPSQARNLWAVILSCVGLILAAILVR